MNIGPTVALPSLHGPEPAVDSYDRYVDNLRENIRVSSDIILARNDKLQAHPRAHKFKVGEWVWVRSHNRSNKLDNIFEAHPAQIVDLIGDAVLSLSDGSALWQEHAHFCKRAETPIGAAMKPGQRTGVDTESNREEGSTPALRGAERISNTSRGTGRPTSIISTKNIVFEEVLAERVTASGEVEYRTDCRDTSGRVWREWIPEVQLWTKSRRRSRPIPVLQAWLTTGDTRTRGRRGGDDDATNTPRREGAENNGSCEGACK